MGPVSVLFATGRVTDSAGARRAAPQPGAAYARSCTSPGGPRGAMADLLLAWRVSSCPSIHRAGDSSLRPQAASLPCFAPWTRPRGGLLLLCGRGPVVPRLSGPGPEAEERGANPGPGAVSPL